MTGSVFFLHLAGAVALLLWATRMVRTGVERAYGDRLRLTLKALLGNPALAIGAGTALAIALQSSTAVSLLVGSFVGSGIVGPTAGLLAVLGADLGSALVVKLLSFDLSLLVPLCLFAGTTIFMASERRELRQSGRIIVGVGLLLLSLQMIGQASEPLRGSPLLPVIVNYLSSDPFIAFCLAALMTWLFHSSVAAVLLVVALATRGLLPLEVAAVLILGANFGGSLIAVVLTRTAAPDARIVPLGNLMLRGTGALLVLIALTTVSLPIAALGATEMTQLVHFHVAFNGALALLGLILARPAASLAGRITAMSKPAEPAKPMETEVSVLHEEALGMPSQALANATRGVVRICESIDLMLQRVFELYEAADSERIDELAKMDDRVDRRHAALKLYLARIDPAQMTEDEALRLQELLGACVKLEQVGDIITRNMLVHVRKKIERKLEFTEEGWRELASFHAAVLANARLAFNVLISRDAETARQLVQEKDRLRQAEKDTARHHFARLREGTVRSVDTSTIHLDTIRDLKQINSLLASIAYPVLEERGLLRGSRLTATG